MPLAPHIEPFYQELGKRIARYRSGHGWSQEDLARQMAPPVTRASIANWELGKQRVLGHTLVQLANVLRVPVNVLVEFSQSSPQHPAPVSPHDLQDDLLNAMHDLSPEDAHRLALEMFEMTPS